MWKTHDRPSKDAMCQICKRRLRWGANIVRVGQRRGITLCANCAIAGPPDRTRVFRTGALNRGRIPAEEA
jgi:hypothetical protein